ncbi:MAG: micrococcal nuclease [Dehalococcoidia bacterium]|nr:micrococcal nuclease [Dehalococcoidia bacterium]
MVQRFIVFLTVLSLLFLVISACRTTAPSDLVLVVDVVDGDTIKVAIGGRLTTVRYIGVDTPETVDPRRDVQPYGPEASAANKKLVQGKMVRLEKDVSETDRFGRLLRYVYVGDVMVNAWLVENGYAQAISYPPDVRHQDLFIKSQREAREARRGLWGLQMDSSSSAPPVPSSAPLLPHDPQGSDRDCGDFRTQAEAQAFYIAAGGPGQDPHRLDSDGNGKACESLP